MATRERTGVMLAKPFEPRLLERFGKEVIVQPKLNGNHIKAVFEPGFGYRLFSSTGYERTYVLPLIKKQLDEVCSTHELTLDGECLVPGMPHAQINGMINRNSVHPDTHLLEFHIFDTIMLSSQQALRLSTVKLLKETENIKIVVSYKTLNEKSAISEHLEAFLSQSYEGIIIRNPNSFYEFGKSSNILKIKPRETDTYKIRYGFEAIDKNGEPKGMLGGLVVEDARGNIFRTGGGMLNHDSRYLLWLNRESLPGKLAVVKYQELSAYGIPEQPILMEIKDDETQS